MLGRSQGFDEGLECGAGAAEGAAPAYGRVGSLTSAIGLKADTDDGVARQESVVAEQASARGPEPLLLGAGVVLVLMIVTSLVLLVRRRRGGGAVRLDVGRSRAASAAQPTDAGIEPAIQGTLASEDKRDVAAEPRPVSRLGYDSYSDQGGREYNEDTVFVQLVDVVGSKGICAVLADGLGGHGGGDVASRAVAEFVVSNWAPDKDAKELASLLEAANILVRSEQTSSCEMRTTVVVLCIGRDRAVWASAGDSRLYRFRDRSLVWQTTDHSVSQMAVYMGQITPDEIRHHEDRARLLKALGQEGSLDADVGEFEVGVDGVDEAFLLCSDGFWEYVLEDEMARTLGESATPHDWLSRMREIHDERCPDDCDNNSAIAVWLTARR